MDINTNIDRDSKVDLLDLEQVAREDNTNTILIDINTNINRDNKVDLLDLKWITREKNAYPLEYYLDQENNSNESKDKDKDYSDSSLLLFNIIKEKFYQYISILFLPNVFYY